MLLLVLLAGCTGAPAEAGASAKVRILHLARGADRPLDTTIWYPADLSGRHPLIIFSHGLGGLPEQFAPLATTWVDAGFVVVAPAYPHTNGRVRVDAGDVRNQPADAAYALERVEKDDLLGGHVDARQVAAVGFSAGGTTTLGLLRAGHDPAIKVAVSVAGRRPESAFGGPAVPVLFLHGDQDPVVPIKAGRLAYAALPWPKRFVVITGAGHGQYLNPGNPDHPRVSAMILDFLRSGIDLPEPTGRAN